MQLFGARSNQTVTTRLKIKKHAQYVTSIVIVTVVVPTVVIVVIAIISIIVSAIIITRWWSVQMLCNYGLPPLQKATPMWRKHMQ